MTAHAISEAKKHARAVMDIMTTGVINTVLRVNGVDTDFYVDMSEIIELDEDFIEGKVSDFVMKHTIQKIEFTHRVIDVALYCKGGFLLYRVTDFGRIHLVGIVLGDCAYSPMIDVDVLPHRFQKTRFIAMATTNYENAIGIKGNAFSHADAAMFAETMKETEYSVVVIGRKLFEAIGGVKLLPNRMVLVFTSQPNYQAEGAFVLNSLDDLMEKHLTKFLDVPKMFIVGGVATFEAFKPLITDWRIVRHHINTEKIHDDMLHRLPINNSVDWVPAASRNMYDKVTGLTARIQRLKHHRVGKLTDAQWKEQPREEGVATSLNAPGFQAALQQFLENDKNV